MTWSAIWDYAKAFAVCLGIVGGVTTIFQIIVSPAWWGRNYDLVIMSSFYLTLMLFLVYLLSRKPDQNSFTSPTLRNVMDDGVLLTEPFPWGGIGMSVSVFFDDDGYERFLAHGEIVNKQENGYFSIRTEPEDASDFLDVAKKQKKSIIIKPGQRIW